MIRIRIISCVLGLILGTVLMAQTEGEIKMKLLSSAFAEGGMIPQKYTCDNANFSPPLSWQNIPTSTKSLVLICDDQDAPIGIWVHWVLFNIPPKLDQLSEKIPAERNLSNGARQGINDFRKIGYGGPCPSGGTHRYFFKLYALDRVLEITSDPTKSDLEEAMEGHILGQCQLMGKYQR